MELPTVSHLVRIEEWDVTINVLAYCRLDDDEARQAARRFLAGIKVQRGHTYEVATTIGIRDPL